jgi:N-acetylmuramoyl-L-alanine amidase
MTKLPESSPTTGTAHVNGKSFFYLLFILGVAFVLATLFTTFPPPTGVLPKKQSTQQYNVIGQEASSSPDAGTLTPIQPVLRIGILAGHSGGDDPGAVCPDALGGIKEIDINTGVASRVVDMLNKEGYEADIYTEWDPALYGLHALAFVAIHTDSCEYVNPEATGFKIAPSSANQQSIRLESCLQDRYARSTGMRLHPGVTTDMSDYHAFRDISNQTPGVIVELGFLNLDHDKLQNNQDDIALGITDGILCFLRNEPITTPQPTSSPTP